MAIFYAEYNKRAILTSPDFNRARHAFRSPRDSYQINLESEQLRYSIKKLYSKDTTLKTDMISKGTTMTEGGTVAVKYNSDANPDEILDGIETLAASVYDARRRIEALERVL